MTKELVHTIFARRSIRKYTSEPVNEEEIKTLLQAAMAAPSAGNRKPWHFIVVRDRQTLNALAEALPYGKMLFNAPLCIAVCGDKSVSESWWVQDCSAATENLLLAATALGLGAVWLGVFPREDRVNTISGVLKIPKNLLPLNLISIGHPAEAKEPRTQYDETRVHHEHWM
jgi:nitroreductase